MSSRRHFLKTTCAVSASYALPLSAAEESGKVLRIGLIADVHKDLVPDADERLTAFVAAMKRENADAIVQLGDFCTPKEANRGFLDIFNGFEGPKWHVIGNHEMDGGFSRGQVVEFFGMKDRYYSFDLGGFHFVVLDANDRPENWESGYPQFIAEDQLEWLKQDLEKSGLNTFVLSHQSLERPACIDNQEAVRAILENAKMPDGKNKVAACFNGHWHIDHHRVMNGIPYCHINSASYFYMPGKWKQAKKGAVDPALAKTHGLFAHTGIYKGPLFTILEIDPQAGKFSLRGMKTEWVGASPEEVGYLSDELENAWIRPEITTVEQAFGKS